MICNFPIRCTNQTYPFTNLAPSKNSQNGFTMDGTSVYEIRETPNRGLGMFAKRSIKRGQRILCEAPLLKPSRNPPPLIELYNDFCSLPPEDQKNYLQLHASQVQIDKAAKQIRDSPIPEEAREQCIEIVAILSTNAFQLYEKTDTDPGNIGIFLDASRINHSCCPNSIQNWNKMVGHSTVHATKAISVDEEITVAYIDIWADRRIRKEKFGRYGFICTCPACDETLATTEEGKASQMRRERLNRLDNDLRFFFLRTLKQQHILGPIGTTVVDWGGAEKPLQAVMEMTKLALEEDLIMDNLPEWCVYPCAISRSRDALD